MTGPQVDDPGPGEATDPAASWPRLATRELLALDDRALHARLVELRAQAMEDVRCYDRWIATIRRRQAGKAGQEAAAKALGVSRATVRRATVAGRQNAAPLTLRDGE